MYLLAALTVISATPATFDVAVARAEAGDTIVLQGGSYGGRIIANRSHATPVQIDASRAQVREVTFRNSAGWTWRGGQITGPREQYYGVLIDNSRRITIADARFSGVRVGASVIRGSEDVVLQNNRFDGVRSDGINIAGARRVQVLNNTCLNFRPIPPVLDKAGRLIRDGDHPDCIQSWVPPGYRTDDVVIRGNQGIGEMQGIIHFGLVSRPRARNFVIENNAMTVTYWHGIAVSNIDGLTLRYNTVTPATERLLIDPRTANARAWMRVDTSTQTTICGNVVTAYPDWFGTRPCGATDRPTGPKVNSQISGGALSRSGRLLVPTPPVTTTSRRS